jgi:hypothetical protein
VFSEAIRTCGPVGRLASEPCPARGHAKTDWRARLATLRVGQADAASADSAERQTASSPAGAIGTIGANGTGVESERECGSPDAAPFYRRAAEEAAVALAAHDPDLARERSEMAAALAAPAADPWQPGKPDPLRDGLLIAALARPPSWSGPTSPPPPGAWCSCCSRSRRSGGRWWREAAEPKGWRCRNCYPPDHLQADQVVEVRT